jgi:hypothetical protein
VKIAVDYRYDRDDSSRSRSCAAALVNPYGFSALGFIFLEGMDSRWRRIDVDAWSSPNGFKLGRQQIDSVIRGLDSYYYFSATTNLLHTPLRFP